MTRVYQLKELYFGAHYERILAILIKRDLAILIKRELHVALEPERIPMEMIHIVVPERRVSKALDALFHRFNIPHLKRVYVSSKRAGGAGKYIVQNHRCPDLHTHRPLTEAEATAFMKYRLEESNGKI